MLPRLNLPPYDINVKGDQVWDRLRKKYILNTPEEWVRQNFIHYLILEKGYPEGRMVSEYLVKYNGMNKRCDIAIFDPYMKAISIIECKAPKIKITEDTFYQIAKYAHVLEAPLLILTNGFDHYCALIDRKTGEMKYVPEIPRYTELEIILQKHPFID